MMSGMRWLLILPLLFCGCSPYSQEDFRAEGQAKCRQIALLLKHVHSSEDYEEVEGALKKKFHVIVDLMIAAEKKHHGVSTDRANRYNEALSQELQRIYLLKGGREWIERCQREPLIRLDTSLQKLRQKREKAYLK
ncbi:MAG: hypothetical protein KR126chlam1_00132 [Chlamydiae bacterium]|nr:hypothetical protein [Chlamydiota bacterium]